MHLQANTGTFYFSDTTILLIIAGFVSLFFLFIIIKKIYYHVRLRKKYFIFPKLNINGISNISMIIAISISIILLLTIISAGLAGIFFRMYPGWRVIIEAILIKIGGLLFGPIIGIFIGCMTDILTVILTGGMFHYGFFILCLIYGFFSGLIRSIINKSTRFNFIGFMFLITLITSSLVTIYLLFQHDTYSFEMLNKALTFKNWQLVLFINGMNISLFLVVFILYLFFCKKSFVNELTRIKYFFVFDMRFKILQWRLKHWPQYTSKIFANWVIKKDKMITKHNNFMLTKKNTIPDWFVCLMHVITITTCVETVVSIILMPLFDQQMGGAMPLDYWIVFRTFMFIPVVLINMLILFPIYKVILPMFKYNYTENIFEKIN